MSFAGLRNVTKDTEPQSHEHLEAQFGKVESVFRDFCGFKIAYHERGLALGIEAIMYNPRSYFLTVLSRRYDLPLFCIP